MRRFSLLLVLFLLPAAVSIAQNWTPVWKMTVPPYLTREDITEMAIVKAGFDTDQDGWGEFLCAWTDSDTNAVMMYEATGDNTYQLVWSWVIPIPINSFVGIAVGDVNNNGVVDLVISLPSVVGTDVNPLRVFFFEWNGVVGQNNYGVLDSGTGLYTYSGGYNFGVADNYDLRPYSLTIEDIDNDGANELIAGVRQAGSGSPLFREVYVVSVQGDFAGFYFCEVEWSYSERIGGSNYSTTTGDLDGDGKREIYMFVWNNFSMRIFECNGDKNYTKVFSIDQLYGTEAIDYGALDAVRVADVNNDGVNELYIAATEPQNKVFVITGITDVSAITPASIKELYTIPVTSGGKLRSMQIADPDLDGKLQMMIAGETNGQIFSLEYKGSGNPADSASWEHSVIFDIWNQSGLTTLTPRLFYGSPATDMDKDGKAEYVFVNYAPDFGTWADDVPLWIIEVDVAADVRDDAAGVPTEVRLLQNYPNPFNPSTTIPFQISQRSRVRLEIYSIYGAHVATLVDGEREAGLYNARWTAGVPSGTYFSRLTVEPLEGNSAAVRDVKKMLLLK